MKFNTQTQRLEWDDDYTDWEINRMSEHLRKTGHLGKDLRDKFDGALAAAALKYADELAPGLASSYDEAIALVHKEILP